MFTADGKPSDDDPRENGPRLGDERATLAESLRRQRLTLELKCSGLDAEAMARRAVVSAGKKAVTAMSGATAALVAICVVAANTPDGSPFVLPVVVIFFVLFMTVPTGWLVLLHYWMEGRSAR
ncbi:MAG TPA: hypothetical protein VFW50_44030 [Streptosporangiaceae bacterium]|nr:hypothetical protein [Streptosporangiaceae bacterium]